MNSYNTNRINIVLSDYFSHLDRFRFLDNNSQPIDHSPQVSVLSPSEVAKLEPLFFLPRRKKTLSSYVEFGVSFNNLMQSCTSLDTNLKLVFDQDQAYIVKASRKEAKRNCVYVSLQSNASSIDKTKAYFHALLLTYMMQKYAPVEDAKILEIEERANILFDPLFASFFEESQRAGWDLSKTGVSSRGYGFTFSREIF
uniref:Root UVB sensitive protein C-terminal domain-containing protein n=1 Tax=Leptocylindrus danicus TaxID=163516 RepID=A0A7S2KA71_9STRA